MDRREIEQALVGMVMMSKTYLTEAIARDLHRGHFADPFLGQLFEACVDLWSTGGKLDLASLSRKMGADRLDEMVDVRKRAPLTQNFAPYLDGLLDANRQVELHQGLAEFSRALAARRPFDPLEPYLERLMSLVASAKGMGPALEVVPMAKALQQSVDAIEAADTTTRGVQSGFPKLDACTGGFHPGRMYVLGARTAVGKTTFALNVALNAALEGRRVAFVTVEMLAKDLSDKALSRMARVPSGKIHAGASALSGEETDRLAHAIGQLGRAPLTIVEVKRPTMDVLAFELMRLAKIEGAELIVVDYLQLFETGDDKYRNAREEAKTVSARLKSLTLSLNVPVLVLSQLNRQAPEDGQPELIHIAESDQIARDADVVMLLYRATYERTAVEGHYLTIAKNRRGQRNTFEIKADLALSSFWQQA